MLLEVSFYTFYTFSTFSTFYAFSTVTSAVTGTTGPASYGGHRAIGTIVVSTLVTSAVTLSISAPAFPKERGAPCTHLSHRVPLSNSIVFDSFGFL